MEKIILASQSPSRKKLMASLNIPFETIPSNADETPIESFSFEEQLKEISMRKALTVFEATKEYGDRIIVAADQNIFFKNVMYGKPNNLEDAYKLIKMMEGSNEIYAYVGNTILHIKDNRIINCINNFDSARMQLSIFPDTILEKYLHEGAPLTKCGGISILDTPNLSLIEGKMSTAIGLTIEYLKDLLNNL